jgi:hypothetical protein
MMRSTELSAQLCRDLSGPLKYERTTLLLIVFLTKSFIMTILNRQYNQYGGLIDSPEAKVPDQRPDQQFAEQGTRSAA